MKNSSSSHLSLRKLLYFPIWILCPFLPLIKELPYFLLGLSLWPNLYLNTYSDAFVFGMMSSGILTFVFFLNKLPNTCHYPFIDDFLLEVNAINFLIYLVCVIFIVIWEKYDKWYKERFYKNDDQN